MSRIHLKLAPPGKRVSSVSKSARECFHEQKTFVVPRQVTIKECFVGTLTCITSIHTHTHTSTKFLCDRFERKTSSIKAINGASSFFSSSSLLFLYSFFLFRSLRPYEIERGRRKNMRNVPFKSWPKSLVEAMAVDLSPLHFSPPVLYSAYGIIMQKIWLTEKY